MRLSIRNNGLYFNKEELELEILKRGNIIFYSKEEILNSLNKTTGFSVVGQLSKQIKEDIGVLPEDLIYIVRLLPTYYCFCNSYGKVLYRYF